MNMAVAITIAAAMINAPLIVEFISAPLLRTVGLLLPIVKGGLQRGTRARETLGGIRERPGRRKRALAGLPGGGSIKV
jgi:hypothetical protein